jgi:hypothetical protein
MAIRLIICVFVSLFAIAVYGESKNFLLAQREATYRGPYDQDAYEQTFEGKAEATITMPPATVAPPATVVVPSYAAPITPIAPVYGYSSGCAGATSGCSGGHAVYTGSCAGTALMRSYGSCAGGPRRFGWRFGRR